MHWTHDRLGRHYTLIHGGYKAVVLHDMAGAWRAILNRRGRTLEHTRFVILSEAQAWCEARLELLTGQRE